MINSQIIAKQKRAEKYNLSPNKCTHCSAILDYDSRHLKFCSHTCSATYINSNKPNNKRKHPKKECVICSTITTNPKYCCKKCMGIGKLKYSDEERIHIKKRRQREAYARYAAKKKYQTPIDEDLSAIKLFYQNCPDGYEVDHKMPISKGGAHSISNLQYLTISDNRKKWCKIMEPPERFELS